MKTKLFLFAFALCIMMCKSQIVNIPNANFKAYLVNNIAINTNGDSDIQVSEATAFTGTIDCRSKSIASLAGIEAFKNITQLNCDDNQLTSLDVSKNTALTYFVCYENMLTSLDVSKNTALTTLLCGQNKLTSLDVSKNTALKSLDCYKNVLTSLDVSKNTALNDLDLGYNQLTSFDVSKNTYLIYLICSANLFTSLDVSKNTELKSLHCYENQLTSLNLSKNTALTDLRCYSNQLRSLDVSKNTALTYLRCQSNQLAILNLKNGNNTAITFMEANNNPNLTCIQVDNATAPHAGWSIPATASYSTNCNYMSVTDVQKSSIQLYPNPTYSKLYFSKECNTIKVYSNDGKLLKEYKKAATINISNLPNGIYQIQGIDSNGNLFSEKVIKK